MKKCITAILLVASMLTASASAFGKINEETAKSLSRDDKFMLIEELSGSLTGKWTEGEADTPFLDVKDHWAKEYVTKASALGLFKGMPDGSFDPDGIVTRAQFVTVLWRMDGMRETEGTLDFTDTKNEIDDFKKAILWAYTRGFVKGISETEFGPDKPITREAAMKILHAYSGGKVGDELLFYTVYDGIFKDSGSISAWAKSSIYWGIYNKLINGTSEDTLGPSETATRAQLAKILVSYGELSEEVDDK